MDVDDGLSSQNQGVTTSNRLLQSVKPQKTIAHMEADRNEMLILMGQCRRASVKGRLCELLVDIDDELVRMGGDAVQLDEDERRELCHFRTKQQPSAHASNEDVARNMSRDTTIDTCLATPNLLATPAKKITGKCSAEESEADSCAGEAAAPGAAEDAAAAAAMPASKAAAAAANAAADVAAATAAAMAMVDPPTPPQPSADWPCDEPPFYDTGSLSSASSEYYERCD
eukprot:TRINITY_DN25213_c0_g1_i1.p1 TRINITY_DN25213_c0_g1~~TRINITY_DN25213_c0_g1_i1.p1  ORF type:complete len:228 (-),score=47.66 TRINITY_DN25213_c0_g1_i1:30-713(-)